MDGNKIDENYDKRAEEEVKAVESNTEYEKVSVVDFQESDETVCENQENDEEAECDVDDNEYVCICNYCENWFRNQESLLIHVRENHLLDSFPIHHLQYGPGYSISM